MKLFLLGLLTIASLNAKALCQYSGPITPMVRDYFQAGLLVQIGTSATTMSNQVDNSRLALDLYMTALKNIETYDDAVFLQGMMTSTAKAGSLVYRFDFRLLDEIVKTKFGGRFEEYKQCSVRRP